MIEIGGTAMSTPTAAPFDPDYPRCRDHRNAGPGNVPVGCPACSEAARWVQDRADREQLKVQGLIKACPMCDAGGVRWDPETHIPVSPLTTCDHATAHAVVVAGIAEREAAAELARRAVGEPAPVPSTATGRAAAVALFRSGRRSVPAQRKDDAAARRSAAARPGLDGGGAASPRVSSPATGPLVVDGVPVEPGQGAAPNGCSTGAAGGGVGAAGRETASAGV